MDLPLNPPYNENDDACQQDCRLGIYKNEVGCIPSDDDALLKPGDVCVAEICNKIYTGSHRVKITSRQDVVEIPQFAFAFFPGITIMEGTFPRLASIGRYAFQSCGAGVLALGTGEDAGVTAHIKALSHIHFGRDALPVLTEIGYGAFRNFHGSIRFVDSPFPALQRIGETAFSVDSADGLIFAAFHAAHNRVVDLTNHQSVSVIDRMAFGGFSGKVLLLGDLPNLEYIGEKAFEEEQGCVEGSFCKAKYLTLIPSIRSETVVRLVDLPKLETVADHAFQNTFGTVELRGTFPRLESIGVKAFTFTANNNVTIALEGGPALRCIGKDAFHAANPAHSNGFSLKGSYPCLNVVDYRNPNDAPADYYYSDVSYNDILSFANDPNRDLIEIDVGLSQGCKAFDSIPDGMQAFRCTELQLECTARRGDNQYAQCLGRTEIDDHDAYTANTPPPKECSLGIGVGGKVTCVEDGKLHSLDRDGSITDSPVVLSGRDDAIAFHNSGFLKYGSKIEIRGRFNRLQRIGVFAFHLAGTIDSSIAFGDGDLPVLVEIGVNAFAGFKGNVRFVGSPFPALRTLLQGAFKAVAGPNSRVELDDHQTLEDIGRGVFEDFPSVTLRGSLPKLEVIESNAFSISEEMSRDSDRCPSTSVVELTDVPMLRRIESSAFLYFCGRVLVEGILPSLEVIARKAFSQCSNATVRLDQGAPALRCIGASAFSHGTSLKKGAENRLVLAGSFPCLLLPSSDTIPDEENEPNNPETWVDGSTVQSRLASAGIQIDVGLRGTCTDFLSTDECRVLGNDDELCDSRGGDSRFTPCLEDKADELDLNLDRAASESTCSLGVFTGSVACAPVTGDDESDCLITFGSIGCANFTTEIIIGTTDQITEIHAYGFYKYGGAVRVQGLFNRLERISFGAFSDAGSAESAIIFGKGSLPVLVEIGATAFQNFHGIIRIASGAFPNLRLIGRESFRTHEMWWSCDRNEHASKSRIELVDQHHLRTIYQFAFHQFCGPIIMKGTFPRLVLIGIKAFANYPLDDGTDSGATNSSLVELINLPRLQLIGKEAFKSFHGTVRMEGCFPMLREVHMEAFSRVSNLTFRMVHGAPVLSCIRERPFGRTRSAQTTQLELTGSFPCLNLEGYTTQNHENWNTPIDIFNAGEATSSKTSLFNHGDRGRALLDITVQLGISQGCDDIPGSFGGVAKEEWCKRSSSQCNAGFPVNPDTGVIECDIQMDELEMFEDDDPSLVLPALENNGTQPSENVSSTTAAPSNTTYYGGNQDRRGGGTASSASSGGKAAGGAVAGVLFVVGIIFALRRRQAQQEQLFGRGIATHIEQQALEFFVANFSHLLSGVDGSRSVAADRASKWLKSTSLDSPTPQRYKVVLGDVMGDNRWYGARYFGLLRATSTRNVVPSPSTAGDQQGRPHGQRGHITPLPEDVVVKVCGSAIMARQSINAADQETLKRFCLEALLVGTLEHDSILKILQVQTSSLPFMVVTERMPNGSLKDYLRSVRPSVKTKKKKLKVEDLLRIGLRLVQACEFLEARKVVHRAIMTKNVLVGRIVGDDGAAGSDALDIEVKLSGFGSLREVLRTDEYISMSNVTEDAMLDVRWMAVESFTHNRFSVKSDVWSFGILLWELFSYARKPYGAFNPSEIAQEVKAGRRLEHAAGCPYVLHDEMTKCWHAFDSRRPTFASLQGTMQLILMKDADALRASVAAATKVSADSLKWLQWNVPNKGWATVLTTRSDCGRFKLETQQQGGTRVPASLPSAATTTAAAAAEMSPSKFASSKCRLALVATDLDETAALKTVFYVLQNLKHPNVVPLVGCNSSYGGGGFAVFFDLPLVSSVTTLHGMLHKGVGMQRESDSSPSDCGPGSQQQQPTQGYLVIDSTSQEETTTDGVVAASEPLHTTVKGCFDLALQMTLALEYVHANQIVHGRLSSHLFYVCDAGSTLRLLVGNTVAKSAAAAAAAEVADDSGGDGGGGSNGNGHDPGDDNRGGTAAADGDDAAATATRAPRNLRWLPYDILDAAVTGQQREEQVPLSTATDVYSYGVLLWELFAARAGGGVPFSAQFPTNSALVTEMRNAGCMPPLLTMDPLSTPEIIVSIYAACTDVRTWFCFRFCVLNLESRGRRWGMVPLVFLAINRLFLNSARCTL